MAKHWHDMVKRGNLFGKLRLDFLFVYESRRDDMIIESGLHQHEPEPCKGLHDFFYHRVRKEHTKDTEGFQ